MGGTALAVLSQQHPSPLDRLAAAQQEREDNQEQAQAAADTQLQAQLPTAPAQPEPSPATPIAAPERPEPAPAPNPAPDTAPAMFAEPAIPLVSPAPPVEQALASEDELISELKELACLLEPGDEALDEPGWPEAPLGSAVASLPDPDRLPAGGAPVPIASAEPEELISPEADTDADALSGDESAEADESADAGTDAQLPVTDADSDGGAIEVPLAALTPAEDAQPTEPGTEAIPLPPTRPARGLPRVATGESTRELLQAALTRLPVGRREFEKLQPAAGGRLSERVAVARSSDEPVEPLEIEYSFDQELSERVFGILERYRVALGHVIIADARTGRLLVYASTDTRRFPPTHRYPAASLVKVVTTAATLRHAPRAMERDCRFRGNPYRFTRSMLTPPKRGQTATFRRALAMSNNQCFAQLAVNTLGAGPLFEQLAAFGWLNRPAPGHDAGKVTAASNDYELGLLGSGLAGTQITPLHAAQLALALSSGTIQQPYWVEEVRQGDKELPLPPRSAARAVLSQEQVRRLRELLTETTRSGTAHRAFRQGRRGLLEPVNVAGKTGSLSGHDPDGRYEWFIGVAPAEQPRVAITVLTVQAGRWMRSSSQLAAEILRQMFCPKGVCSSDAALRFVSARNDATPAARQTR